MDKPERKDPIIYHLDSYDDVLRQSSKNNKSTYPDNTEWMWGNIITNKRRRTIDKYAIVMCPNGEKAHYVNRNTFIRFFSEKFEHVYVKDIREVTQSLVLDNIIKQIDNLTDKQRAKISIALIRKALNDKY